MYTHTDTLPAKVRPTGLEIVKQFGICLVPPFLCTQLRSYLSLFVTVNEGG